MSQGYDGLPSYYGQSSNPLTPNFGFCLAGMDPILAENFVIADTAIASGGGGTKVQVNGVNVNNPNFNNITPTPPAGNTNVLWQVLGSSVSAYVPNASPGGSTTDIQFNDGGVFGGAATLTWDKVNENIVFGNQTGLQLNGNYTFSGSFSNLWQLYPAITASGQTTVIDLEPTTTSTIDSNDLTAFQIVHTLAAGALNTSYFSAAAIQTDRTTGDTGTITTFIGLDVDCFNDAGNVTNQSGMFCSSSNNGSGTIADNAGLRVAHGVVAGTNTIDAGIHINSPLTSGTSLGTCYGLYIDDQTTGGAKNPNPYAIFVVGGKSSFKSVLLTSTLVDGAGSVGTSGQVLSSTVTGVAWVNATPMTTLGDIIYEDATPAPARLAGNTTATKMYLSQTGTGSISAVPAWAQINYADITGTTPTPPSGSVLWSALGNAAANLTLANAGFTTTINQTSAVAFTLANTTAATSGTAQSSPIFTTAGQYWNGSASATDQWTVQDIIANGTNGASTLTFAHTGTTGAARLSAPSLQVTNNAGSASACTLQIVTANTGFYGQGTLGNGITFATGGVNIWQAITAPSNCFMIPGTIVLGFAPSTVSNCDIGFTRLAAGSLALGNGTAGDFTGALTLGALNQTTGTAATSSVSQSSPIHTLAGTYWNGSASAVDSWTIQDIIANGTNGTPQLTFNHSGSSGASTVVFNVAQGIRIGAVSGLAISGATNSTIQTLTGGTNITMSGLINGQANASVINFANGSTFQNSVTPNGIVNIAGTFGSTGTFPGFGLTITPTLNQTGSGTAPITLLAAYSVNTAVLGTVKLLGLGHTTASGVGGTFTDEFAVLRGGTISTYNSVVTVANGVPSEYATIDLTGQTGTIGTTTLYAVPSSGAGMYRLSYYLDVSTAGTGGTVTATFGWNDGNSAETLTSAAVNLNALSGGYTQGVITFYSAASQNITYATTVTSALGSPQYILRSRLEFLG